MQEAGNIIKDVGKTVSDLGGELTTKVTLPLVAIGAMGVKSFAEVDKTMQLANKTMGNTADVETCALLVRESAQDDEVV